MSNKFPGGKCKAACGTVFRGSLGRQKPFRCQEKKEHHFCSVLPAAEVQFVLAQRTRMSGAGSRHQNY